MDTYTKQGFRVIALAHRLVETQTIHKLQKAQREDFEHRLTFLGSVQNSYLQSTKFFIVYLRNHFSPGLGLIVLENRLKPDTKAVLNQLQTADVRTIMVTGTFLYVYSFDLKRKHDLIILFLLLLTEHQYLLLFNWKFRR